MDSKFDVVIFGASGCVGRHTVLEAVHILEGLTWAIAGRSREKLELVLEQTFEKSGQDLSHIPILIADSNNPESIETIVEKCEVLINCCGPYQLCAELIINKCIISGTHYVDMCSDPYFNELMELRYHEKAAENDVYVVSSCGFQSFPVDIALNVIKEQFNGTVNHVDAYVRYNFGSDFNLPICPLFSTSTWFSIIWSWALDGELPWLREELRKKPLPLIMPKQPLRDLFHNQSSEEDSIFLRFPFVDQQAVERSQYQFYAQKQERPIQFYKYLEFSSFLWACIFLIWFITLSLLSQFCITRKLVISYPKLFSIGICSPDGPDEYTIQLSSYEIILIADGWSRRLTIPATGSTGSTGPLDHRMSLEISGSNPVYGLGCLCLLLSARCIVEDRDKMPESGGVYSPGYAFHKTNILEKLQLYPNYISFRIL